MQRRINGDTSRRTGLYSDGDHYDLPAGFKSSSGSESGSNRGSNPSSGPVPVMLGLGPGLGLGVRPQNSGFGLCLGLAFEGLGHRLLMESPIWYPATIVWYLYFMSYSAYTWQINSFSFLNAAALPWP